MKLYNTLTRTKEAVTPITPQHVSLYTCGPTVYHYYHIGNLRNAVFNDTLKRVLLAEDNHIHHVMNITDVGHLTGDTDHGNDKLQERAAKEGKDVWEVAQYYTETFFNDMNRLNVLEPTRYVKATETIEQQIAMILELINTGFAYQTEEAIYFDTTKLKDYGKLSGQNLKEKQVGVRAEVVTDPDKRHPQDFALWFFTVGRFEDHAMRWESPWGEGFPGWHLECSAIIEAEFGDTIDIHTGGVDHIGTHHTNEIAQSEASHNGAPLAHYWMHIEFLLVDGHKMSKSLENTYTLNEVTARGYDPMALRLLYLQSHYRTQQNFTWDALDAATNYLHRLQAWADGQFQAGAGTLSDDSFHDFCRDILAKLSDDLNTPEAMVIMSQLLDDFESNLVMPTAEQVGQIDALFGLGLSKRLNITPEQEAIILEREGARQAKDYELSDHARSLLKDQGIELDDTPSGPRWYRRPQTS
ncbi:MAG TPA: cysteine--tRNA ligase [Candidatus Saccharimonadia bacterium]